MKIIKLSILLIFFQGYLEAQVVSPLPILSTPKSPNVASMERYGNYEVDLFRGLPKILIPLCEIKTKGTSIPISISYHASGVKVTDIASWVGLGWNLNAGGAISRNERGRPDEQGMFNHTNPATIDPTTPNGYLLLKSIFDNTRDAEPDIFSFTVPGDNGKWVYINNQPEFIPYVPYKINKINGVYQLINASGTNYFFGENGVVESSYTQRGSQSSGTGVSLLTKIRSADLADSVVFNYYPTQSLSYPVEWEDYVSVIDNVQRGELDWNTTPMTANYTSGVIQVSSGGGQRLLQEIIFATGKIVFELNANSRTDLANAKALKRISVYGKEKGNYVEQKVIDFHSSYFGAGATARLKLDSLTIASVNTSEKEIYRFTYDESSPFPVPNTRSRDFWGYYNGKNNYTLIPGTIVPFSNGYITGGPNGQYKSISIGGAVDSRDPDSLKAQLGILKRIQFPTGGHSIFNYELNRYSNGGELSIGGGLRVRSIFTFNDDQSSPMIKSYTYGAGYVNASTAYKYRYLQTDCEEISLNSPGLPFGYVKQSWVNKYYASNAYIDINAFDGTNVYYPVVTEYTGTPEKNLYKTVYRYSMSVDQIVTNVYERIPYASSTYWKRGLLLSKEDFKIDNNNKHKLIHAVYNDYVDINDKQFSNAGILVMENVSRTGAIDENLELGEYGHRLPYRYGYYDIYTGARLPSGRSEYYWDSLGSITNKTLIQYNDKGLVSSEKSITSTGDTSIGLKKYPFEYSLQGNLQGDFSIGVKNLNDLNVINQPIEEVTGIKRVGSDLQVTSGLIKSFYPNTPIIKDNYYYERNSFGSNSYITSSISSSGQFTLPPRYSNRLKYSLIDDKKNIIEYSKDGSKNALVWNEKGSIIAAISNAGFNQVAFSSFEDIEKGNWMYNEANIENENLLISGNKVLLISPSNNIVKNNVPVGTYIVSYIGKSACLVNGIPPAKTTPLGSLTWSYFEHELTLSSVSSITVSTTVSTMIDNARLQPKDAMMKSFAYTPFGNISAEMNESGMSLYYNYDGLQRLSRISDENNKVLKKNSYNIQNYPALPHTLPVFYYSLALSSVYRKGNCSITENGSYVTYNVPYGKYISFISQSDADQKAQNDLESNGQSVADLEGSCILKSHVEWKPSGLYCQSRANLEPPKNPGGYNLTTASSPGSNNYTTITITRSEQDFNSRATVNIVVYYGGGSSNIYTALEFEVGDQSAQKTVGGSQWMNYDRAGSAILSIVPGVFYTYTETYVYGTRSKYVGGDFVLIEPNLIGIGDGPYFLPIPGAFNKCPNEIQSDPSNRAFTNTKYFKEFYKECAGEGGARVTYTVPAGKYTSLVSQEAVDEIAINDINTNGQTYANSIGTCPISTSPVWVATGGKRCVKNTQNQNTGYQEQEEKDMNNNSSTFNQLRWVNIGQNINSCPVGNF